MVGLIMIPLFAMLIHNRFVNGHYHRLPSGQIVYHYHPYQQQADAEAETSGSPYAGHHHSSLDFSLISVFTGAELFVGLVFLFIGFVLAQWVRKFVFSAILFLNRFKVRYSDPRAPPSLA